MQEKRRKLHLSLRLAESLTWRTRNKKGLPNIVDKPFCVDGKLACVRLGKCQFFDSRAHQRAAVFEYPQLTGHHGHPVFVGGQGLCDDDD
jgi:hypothetical protein